MVQNTSINKKKNINNGGIMFKTKTIDITEKYNEDGKLIEKTTREETTEDDETRYPTTTTPFITTPGLYTKDLRDNSKEKWKPYCTGTAENCTDTGFVSR